MPLYEYRCMKCRRLSEQMRPMAKRNDPATCATCGAAAARIISKPQKPVIVNMTANQILRDKETWR